MVLQVQPSMEGACHPVAPQVVRRAVLQGLLLQVVLQRLQVDPMVAFLLVQVPRPVLQEVLPLALQVVLLAAHQANLQVVRHLSHQVLPKVAN